MKYEKLLYSVVKLRSCITWKCDGKVPSSHAEVADSTIVNTYLVTFQNWFCFYSVKAFFI